MTKQYDTPLILTTPHMTGTAVRDAQWLMAGNSRFPDLKTYKDGKPDGDYGPVTAQATERTKYWLGYAMSACDQVFGQRLYEYLRPEHWRELPKDYRTRRAERLAAAAETPGMKALKLAKLELGYHEDPPYSNRTKYGVEYKFNGVAWCAIFESIMFKHAGFSYFHYAAVEQIYRNAGAGVNKLRIVFTPQRGDVACYRHGSTYFAHTAFFDELATADDVDASGTRGGPGRFWDVGGNTSADDFSNGGEVARQIRTTDLVTRWVRVG